MQPILGTYEAIVTDNSHFFNTGKIKVRIQGLYNGRIDWDLSNNYSNDDFTDKLEDDVQALVSTGFGGGLNHGLFALPQVNSIGTVQFLGGNIKKPIWTGSFFRPEYDEHGKVVRVNVPNDNPFVEGNGADGINKAPDDAEAQKRIIGDFGTIIFRQKSTTGPGSNKDPDNMNWNKQRSQNLIIIDKDEIKITHFSKWDESGDKDTGTLKQWEDVIIGTHKTIDSTTKEVVEEYPEIIIQVSDIDSKNKKKTTGLKINNNEVGLTVSDESRHVASEITSTSENITIKARNTDNGDTTLITQNAEKIIMNNETVNVMLEKNDATVSAPKGKLRLSGAEVILGEGGGYILTKDDPLPMRMEDGSIIKASKCKA